MATTKPAGPKSKGLSIAAKREKFYSGGITEPFGYEPRTIALSDLTKDQVEDLKADPFLIVNDVEIEVEAEKK
jgi:hypothetical protein